MAETVPTAKWSVLSVDVDADESSKPVTPALPSSKEKVVPPRNNAEGAILPLSRAIQGAMETDPAAFFLKFVYADADEGSDPNPNANEAEESIVGNEPKDSESSNKDVVAATPPADETHQAVLEEESKSRTSTETPKLVVTEPSATNEEVVSTLKENQNMDKNVNDDSSSTCKDAINHPSLVAASNVNKPKKDITVEARETATTTNDPAQATDPSRQEAMKIQEAKVDHQPSTETEHLPPTDPTAGEETSSKPMKGPEIVDEVPAIGKTRSQEMQDKDISIKEPATNGKETACFPENKETGEVEVLVLISRQSFDREVLQNQQNVMTILDAKGIKYTLLDGADAANKEERNALFALSGLRAKYPQFFLIRGGKKTFYGNMDTFNEANDSGSLACDFGCQVEETSPVAEKPVVDKALPVQEPVRSNETVAVNEKPVDVKKGAAATGTESTEMSVLVLISRQSFDRVVLQNQQNAMTVLDSKGIKYQLLDGSNPANKEERNALFTLSGLHAQYPQFFLLRGGEKIFYGNMDTFNEANEVGTLADCLHGQVAEYEEEPTSKKPVVEFLATPETVSTKPPVLVLISRQSFDHEVLANQQNACTILDSKGINYELLDGSDPANKEQRNALFALSGLRAKYPQFFLVRAGENVFYGNMDTFNDANEAGALDGDLGGQVEKPETTNAVGGALVKDRAATDKTQKTRSLDFPVTAPIAIDKLPATDITIFGATSFVAKHVITYLVQVSVHLPQPLKITFAGRNSGKLGILKEEWEKKMELLLTASPAPGKGKCAFDTHVAESADKYEIRRMAARTRVVLGCAGPFAEYGSNVVAACAEFGTDYVDITGELSWAGEMRERHGPAAASTGARIISFCGFDSIPSDLAVFAAVTALRRESRKRPVDIEKATTFHSTFGGPGGGTVKTMAQYPLNLLYCFGRSVPYLLDDPLVLVHPELKNDPRMVVVRNKLAKTEWYNQLLMFHAFLKGGFSTPFMMAPVNAKVVHASAVSLGYGANFSYQERYLPVGFRATTQLQTFSFIPALFSHLGVLLFMLILKLPFLGRLICEYAIPPGSGLSDPMCAACYSEVYAEVRGPIQESGRVDKANAFIRFEGDPGNFVTAQCVSESALCLLLDKKDLPKRSKDGFGTPSELLGEALLKRLQKTAIRPVQFVTHVRKRTAQSEWKMYP